MARAELEEHARLSAVARAQGLPAPPDPPLVSECCLRHCDPCVWDYFARALSRWRERHDVAKR